MPPQDPRFRSPRQTDYTPARGAHAHRSFELDHGAVGQESSQPAIPTTEPLADAPSRGPAGSFPPRQRRHEDRSRSAGVRSNSGRHQPSSWRSDRSSALSITTSPSMTSPARPRSSAKPARKVVECRSCRVSVLIKRGAEMARPRPKPRQRPMAGRSAGCRGKRPGANCRPQRIIGCATRPVLTRNSPGAANGRGWFHQCAARR